MRQHRQRYFHVRHRRPSPAVKWHHATRARIRFPQPGARQGRHAAKTRGQGQRRWQEAVPAEGHRPRSRARSAPRSTRAAARARGGLAWIAVAPAETGRDRSHHSASCCGRRCAAVLAAIVSATVRGPVASARDDPRRPAAISARPQHRQLPRRTPGMTCRHSRPESRKGAERRAGIRNLCPFRIPVLPRAPSPAIRLLARRAGRGTLRPAIPLGQRNAVPRERPLKAAGGEVRIPVRPCRKHHWMLEFLAAPTRPGTPGQAGSELSFQCGRPGAVPLAV